MTQFCCKYMLCIFYIHFIIVFVLINVIVKINSMEINHFNSIISLNIVFIDKFIQKSSKLSDLQEVPYGAFMGSPAYLLSHEMLGIYSYSNSETSREVTKLVYSYHTESNNGLNYIIIDRLDTHNSFIYMSNETLLSFSKECEIEGNYHILKYIFNYYI